jgi:HD-GYP domain-containing protein (c-di-GMP phosphodiesterase class II)
MVDLRNHWLAADELASRLGLGEPVRRSLKESFERWDGMGFGGSKGEEIKLTSRVVCLADAVTAYYEQDGESAAVQVARQRSGTQFAPALVKLFCANAAYVLSGLEGPSQWAQVIDAEPTLARVMTDLEFDAALEAIADFIDLKSPYTLGHSRSVGDLFGAAAGVLGLPDEDCIAVRRAGLVHDLGRFGVPNSIWDKPGPLTRSEMERVRLHPYLSDGCCPLRKPWPRSPRSRSSTTSGWTDPVIRGDSTTHPSACRGGCWEQPIAMRRQRIRGLTGRS